MPRFECIETFDMCLKMSFRYNIREEPLMIWGGGPGQKREKKLNGYSPGKKKLNSTTRKEKKVQRQVAEENKVQRLFAEEKKLISRLARKKKTQCDFSARSPPPPDH